MKSNILFLSTENAIRSQIAEAFAKQMLKQDVAVYSAGVAWHTSKIHPMTLALMNGYGIDISMQYPKKVWELAHIAFDLVVTLSIDAKKNAPVLAGFPTFLHWLIEDPLDSIDNPSIRMMIGKAESPIMPQSDKTKLEQALQHCCERIKVLVYELVGNGYLDAFVFHKKNVVDRIFDNLSDGIIAHGLDKRVIMFSKSASLLTGISEETAINKQCDEIFGHPLCGENCTCDRLGSIDILETRSYNTVFKDANGMSKECKVTVVPMKDEEGYIQGVVATLCDITSQKSLERLLAKESSFGEIVGNDFKMRQIFQQIRDVSSYDYPVHISGETGTGKELVAKAIHHESRRKDHPFIAINCGALPAGLIESELFGHVKGAFTGAFREKKGRFELAEGGTLFLDEITDLPKAVQVKLLRCLQEGVIEKVGSEKSIKTDVRIISATNLDLKNEMANNRFREDLYYRLNVIPIEIPPLRSRKNDIQLLCNHFLEKTHLENKDIRHSLSKGALTAIIDYHWPGNVRELENALKYAVVKCQTDTIQLTDLPQEIHKIRGPTEPSGIPKKLEKRAVIDALRASKGSKVKAAKALGVGRATLYRYFERHPEVQDAHLKRSD